MTDKLTAESAADDLWAQGFGKYTRMSSRHTLMDYWAAPGSGPLNYQWADKPHRLLYDLIGEVLHLRAELAEHERIVPERIAVAEKSESERAELFTETADALDAKDKEIERLRAKIPQWIKPTDRLPEKPGKKYYEYVDCLIVHKGEVKARPWNCEYLCFDDVNYDDFFCGPEHVEYWMLVPALPAREVLS